MTIPTDPSNSNEHYDLRDEYDLARMTPLPKGRFAPPQDNQRRIWEEEFEAMARRPLPVRLRYAFVKTYKPVMDDAPYRSFESMAEYRQWCETNLPSWLGYGRV